MTRGCELCARVVVEINRLRGEAGIPGAGFKTARTNNLRNLHARHAEYGVEACVHVARVKAHQWLKNGPLGKMVPYYRPTTLFRPTHFPEYLAEPDTRPRQRADVDQFGRLQDGGYPCGREGCGHSSWRHPKGTCEECACLGWQEDKA